MRVDLRAGEAGTAHITDSSDSGPNALIVVDLATGSARRRLHEPPSTKAEPLSRFRPVVEGRPFLERSRDGSTQPVWMGADGTAISADGERLFYRPLASRRWCSVSTAALRDPSLDDEAVAATVVDEGTGSDRLETDDGGRVHLASCEHDAVLRSKPHAPFHTPVDAVPVRLR
ncbi:L-dopachrome tautomerase-related protein [Kineococcus auxinigenes]|uniref:L-dopachrome tautomerase-related protein n=1 Tax=unclassified Kineococcus TaxID=2621656 RepID=UPI003D7C8D5C